MILWCFYFALNFTMYTALVMVFKNGQSSAEILLEVNFVLHLEALASFAHGTLVAHIGEVFSL